MHLNKYSYLGIGSNLANRKRNIQKATAILKKHKKLKILKVSSIYDTAPWGYVNQKNFYNIAIKIETNLKPKQLLKVCREIEKRMSRKRKFKWGPRVIDVDILIHKNTKINTKELTIPHKYIKQRLFVLFPLSEIDKNIRLGGQTLDYFIDRLSKET